jgi:hypothetical protein
MNVEIFNNYMHRNIRGPSRASTSKDNSMGHTRFTYYRRISRSGDLSLRNSASVSNQGIFGNSLFEIFAGNDRIKSLSRIRSDKKTVKHAGVYLARLMLVYDATRKQFMIQGTYSDGDSYHFGIVHSALDVFEPLP